ncbi:MAG: hypothetical protein GX643_02980, partial [Acidimicrobiales bacterium]|nr:hypothetical protein [Acidimicrobiales bacterium]
MTFDALLEIQSHDTRLDQLRHQMETLPERKERDALLTQQADLEARLAAQRE